MERKLERKASYIRMVKVMVNCIYSDDMQGATDYPEYFGLDDLKETYALFGMGIKDYLISESPFDIHFLGCSNARWANYWVPIYDEERMLFAMAYTGGRLSDRERTQRLSGLAHNLAFSEKYANIAVGLCSHLNSIGRWVGAPVLSLHEMKIAYTPIGSQLTGERGPVDSTRKPAEPEHGRPTRSIPRTTHGSNENN